MKKEVKKSKLLKIIIVLLIIALILLVGFFAKPYFLKESGKGFAVDSVLIKITLKKQGFATHHIQITNNQEFVINLRR